MKSYIRRNMVILLAFVLASSAGLAAKKNTAANEVHITLIQTTDVHGRVMPWDYFKEKIADNGLARVATYIKGIRQEGRETLLLDSGDTIQGTPLTYYYERLDPAKPNPMMMVMNTMGYDAMTVGNHEYNYGLSVLEKCRQEAHFPLLSANTVKADGTPYFQPYVVKEFHGVRVGIIGLTTPNIPNWEVPDNYRGLSFGDPVESARRWVAELRQKEHVDAVVISLHGGFEADLDTGKPNGTGLENQAYAIATQVAGVDVLVTGHTHENIPPRLLNGVLVCQAHRFADQLSRLDLVFSRSKGRWQLTAKSGENVPMNETVPPDPEVVRLVTPYHDTVCRWVNSPIGVAEAEFTSKDIFTSDNALMDLMHQVLRERTGAQLSMVSYLPGYFITIDKGPIRVRDIYALYIYENTPTVLKLKGRDIKDALERSAEYYDHLEWESTTQTLKVYPSPSFRRYNFYTLAGANYALDPTRPVGQRVMYLEFQGKPMDLDAEYTIAVSNYQAAGAGGAYAMMKHGQITAAESADIRDLIMEYIRLRKSIYPFCDQNWHLAVPAVIIAPERR